MLKTDLVEIKRGNTGTGLLIEQDGYISMLDDDNKQIYEAIEHENGGWHVPNPFIVSAVFQKCDIQNANGRIYPEHVLKPQVELYKKKIEERRAYGECYTPDAMILTKNGWKQLSNVQEGEEILTLNCETNTIEVQPILKKIVYDYDGELISIKGRNIDDLVTPNHGFPIYDRNNNFKDFYTAEQIMNNNVPDQSHSYIPKRGEWVGENDEFIILPQIDEIKIQKIPSKKLRIKYSEPLKIEMTIFAKFMGIYLAEGSFSKKGYRVNIHQKKKHICCEIENMLDEWGIKYTINAKKDGTKTYVISDMRLHNYIQQFGTCYDKYVPYEIKKQNKNILTIFYDWFVMGDGRQRGYGSTTDVFSTSKQLALDLNEIQLKIGYSGNYHIEERYNDRFIHDRLIKKENTKPLHFTMKSLTKGIYLDDRFMKCTKQPYKGQVMCVEVKNHTWYVMQNNKCHWTKNCNHPADSTIDLGRIAMNIVELHWEGKTLVGKLELILSEGFRKNGIISCLGDTCANLLLNGLKIGVSSRGVGSVETHMGKYVVGNDFELICWDLVSEPSTPGAWISDKPEKLIPYIESKEPEKAKTIIEKIEKTEKILQLLR